VEQTEEPVELVERVAALDIGKARVTACVRVPHHDKPGGAARRSASTPRWCAGWGSWSTGCAARAF